jgi:methyltransferase (TIGR00027 family)
MHQARPSQTAMRVAQRRAAHQLLDSPPILSDPLALPILGPQAATQLRAQLRHGEPEYAKHVRVWMAVRSRFAEDSLAQSVAAGTRQYVVLGAGLDTFAYRNPFPALGINLRVFEVDFPATQAWKRQLLAAAQIPIPGSVTFSPVDFERESLAHGLARSGFDSSQPAFFSWLGVTMYLAPETTLAILGWVHQICPRNSIVFDYMAPRASLPFRHRIAFDLLASRVAKAGEPFIGFFSPDSLASDLHTIGYPRVENWDAERLNARYCALRTDGLKVAGTFGGILYAGA